MLSEWERMPAKARLALALGLTAAAVVLVAYLSLPGATLTLVCRHGFKTADLTVSIDGAEARKTAITGSVTRKWLGVVEKTGGVYTTTLPVRPGKRLIGIQLRAPGYDISRSIEGSFRRGEEATLSVDAERGLALAWRNAAPAASRTSSAADPPAASGSGWLKHAGTVLLTMLGAMVSGTIGVLAQDLLRRARGSAAKNVTREDTKAPS